MSRRPLEAQHTNPFRQSIIARSESPFEPVSGMTNFGNSSAPSLSRTASVNPFGEVLEPEFDLDDCEDEDLLEEPPAYNEVVTAPKKVEEKPRASSRPSQERRGSDRASNSHARRSHDRSYPDEKARSGSHSGPSGRKGSYSGSGGGRSSSPPEQDRERLDREHRRLIEREKYYRERRRELERRQNRTPEEQQRDKERRRRRREAKAAQEGSHSGSGNTVRSRSKSESVVKLDKKGRPLDTIDKMDVTGLFGPGAFHHDGPFDACNPHRNKKTNPRPPVAAFNIQGPNFSLVPSDVSEERSRQEATVFGKYEEQSEEETPSSTVHGSTTMGLGATTFMDGTPASKDAIQEARLEGRPTRSLSRRYNQSPDSEQKGGLLGRVRSLRRPN